MAVEDKNKEQEMQKHLESISLVGLEGKQLQSALLYSLSARLDLISERLARLYPESSQYRGEKLKQFEQAIKDHISYQED
jgi:heme oxygenase